MVSMVLLAQVAGGVVPASTSAAEWTLLGLLASVLTGVGAFLRYYLPRIQTEFNLQLKEERQAWSHQLILEQARSERVLQAICAEFRSAVAEFKVGMKEHTAALSEATAHLRELHAEFREFKHLSNPTGESA